MAVKIPIETDVLIAGAGIAGAALAAGLRGSGLRVMVLEKSAEPLDTARGDHLQPSTLEILERWGVLEALVAGGAEQRLGSVWYSAAGDELLHSSFDGLDIPHPYYLYLNHEKIGEILLAEALRDERVSLHRPIRNWWLEEQGPDGLTLRVGRADEEDLFVQARILVGADGRSSRVRKMFDFDADSYRYERPIVVLFGRPSTRDAGNRLEAHLGPVQMVAVIPRTGGLCKIGVPIDPAHAAAWRRSTADELQAKLAKMLPHRQFTELEFADIYPPVYLRTSSWVHNNVVLVGDACHAMHPARSQGMNTSIRCIDALAGALRDCAQPLDADTAGQVLLDYEAAYKPGIESMLEENHRHGLEMDQSGEASYQKTCESLAAVQANPAVLEAFTRNAAGYPARPDD